MRAAPRVTPLGEQGRRRLWRGLAVFWLLVLLAAGGTAATLAWMGAPVETAPRVLIPPPATQPNAVAPAPAAQTPLASATERAAPAPPQTADSVAPPPATAPLPPPAPAASAQPPQASPADPPAPAVATAVPPPTLPDAPEPPPLPADQQAAAHHAIPAPDPALLEDSPAGPLPRIAADGRQPRQAYARPFDRADTRPRIGLVVR